MFKQGHPIISTNLKPPPEHHQSIQCLWIKTHVETTFLFNLSHLTLSLTPIQPPLLCSALRPVETP